jgi:hypothetical protein
METIQLAFLLLVLCRLFLASLNEELFNWKILQVPITSKTKNALRVEQKASY